MTFCCKINNKDFFPPVNSIRGHTVYRYVFHSIFRVEAALSLGIKVKFSLLMSFKTPLTALLTFFEIPS